MTPFLWTLHTKHTHKMQNVTRLLQRHTSFETILTCKETLFVSITPHKHTRQTTPRCKNTKLLFCLFSVQSVQDFVKGVKIISFIFYNTEFWFMIKWYIYVYKCFHMIIGCRPSVSAQVSLLVSKVFCKNC